MQLTIEAYQQVGQQKSQEEADIVQAYAVVDPAAVMIKLCNAPAILSTKCRLDVVFLDTAGCRSGPK